MKSPPTPADPTDASAAAALRRLLTTYFSDAELQVLAHDLGVDYEELAGDTKSAKAIQLIQTVARRGTIIDLVELCRRERPDANWNAVGVAAATHPDQFLFVPDESKPLLNTSPDRALRIGIALGVVMMVLLGCGFGGGLLAGQIVMVTLSPVQPDPSSLQRISIKVGNRPSFTPQDAGMTFSEVLQAVNNLPPGTAIAIQMNNQQATTLADQRLSAGAGAPVSDIHIRFLDTGEATVDARVNPLGNRRVVLAYTATVESGRIILTPTSAWMNIVEIPNTTFGWVPLPQNTRDAVTQWAQAQLDAAARNFWFTDVPIEQDKLTLMATTR